MNILRRIGLILAAILLPIFLFTEGLFFTAYNLYATPGRIKGALRDSGVYDQLVNDLLTAKPENSEEPSTQSNQDIPTDRPEVKQIIQGAASPEFLKTQAENFLDSVFTWIKGDTQQIQFEINLTEAKTKLADGLVQYANDRVATLPACTAADLKLGGDFDVFNATCVPKGTDTAAAVNKIRDQINTDFFEDPIITANDINTNGEPLEQKLHTLRSVHEKLSIGVWFCLFAAILLAAAVLALSRPWRAGLKRVGINFVSVGATTTVLGLVITLVIKGLSSGLAGDANLQISIAGIIGKIADIIRSFWVGYGIVILLLGIAMLISLNFIKAGKEPEKTDTSEKPDKQDDKAAKHDTDNKNKTAPSKTA